MKVRTIRDFPLLNLGGSLRIHSFIQSAILRRIRKFHVVVVQKEAKKCTKKYDERNRVAFFFSRCGCVAVVI